jgi:peptidoglycan/LPS O-acetylase OafA/YrhL
VVLYHAHFFALRGGFVGVDVFFVLSGFLITSLLASEFATNKRISLRQFYARRARRLLPASTLVVVATVIAGRIWLEPLRLRDLGHDAISSAGFFANITFANRGTDYLQSTLPPSALQHFWSLAVEEQFYVVLLYCSGVHSVFAHVQSSVFLFSASPRLQCAFGKPTPLNSGHFLGFMHVHGN